MLGHRGHDLPSNRRYDWDNHDGENNSRSQHADPVRRTLKQSRPPQGLSQPGLDVLPKQRNHYKNRPESVDHARDRSQQLGGECQGSFEPGRRNLGDKNRHSDRERNGNDESQNGGHDRSKNKRQRPELIVHRIPVPANKKLPSKSMPSQAALGYQFVNDESHQGENRDPATQHDDAKRPVCPLAITIMQQRYSSTSNFCGKLLSGNGFRTRHTWRS